MILISHFYPRLWLHISIHARIQVPIINSTHLTLILVPRIQPLRTLLNRTHQDVRRTLDIALNLYLLPFGVELTRPSLRRRINQLPHIIHCDGTRSQSVLLTVDIDDHAARKGLHFLTYPRLRRPQPPFTNSLHCRMPHGPEPLRLRPLISLVVFVNVAEGAGHLVHHVHALAGDEGAGVELAVLFLFWRFVSASG